MTEDEDQTIFKFVFVITVIAGLVFYAVTESNNWAEYSKRNECKIIERNIPVTSSGYDGKVTTRRYEKWFCNVTSETVWR